MRSEITLHCFLAQRYKQKKSFIIRLQHFCRFHFENLIKNKITKSFIMFIDVFIYQY